ncbi:MAG: PEP-CTERM sorting domain-containing protein [Pirellulales bacterium]
MRHSLAALIALTAIGIGAANAAVYKVKDLSTLGGTESYALAINNSGQIVGASKTIGDRSTHGFVYNGSRLLDLGTLVNPGSRPGSSGNAINTSGQIVGSASMDGDEFGTIYRAFLYGNGGMTEIGPGFSVANAINDKGEIVGELGMNSDDFFVAGGLTLPSALNGKHGHAHDINNTTQIVGEAFFTPGGNHAFLYYGSWLLDLGTLGGSRSSAYAINNLGQVVGEAQRSDGSVHAFRWSGAMTDLGALRGMNSRATAINDKGQIVGYSGLDDFLSNRAFLYSNNTLTDLNTRIDPASGWTLLHAYGINDRGQIVGDGTNVFGQRHAFLLTPVPEPSTLVLASLGAVLALVLRWRRK